MARKKMSLQEAQSDYDSIVPSYWYEEMHESVEHNSDVKTPKIRPLLSVVAKENYEGENGSDLYDVIFLLFLLSAMFLFLYASYMHFVHGDDITLLLMLIAVFSPLILIIPIPAIRNKNLLLDYDHRKNRLTTMNKEGTTHRTKEIIYNPTGKYNDLFSSIADAGEIPMSEREVTAEEKTSIRTIMNGFIRKKYVSDATK